MDFSFHLIGVGELAALALGFVIFVILRKVGGGGAQVFWPVFALILAAAAWHRISSGVPMAEAVAYALRLGVFVILGRAAAENLLSDLLPNILSLAIFALFLAHSAVLLDWQGAIWGTVIAVVIAGIGIAAANVGFPPAYFKLIAALGAWVGPSGLFMYLIVAFVVLALMVPLFRLIGQKKAKLSVPVILTAALCLGI